MTMTFRTLLRRLKLSVMGTEQRMKPCISGTAYNRPRSWIMALILDLVGGIGYR